MASLFSLHCPECGQKISETTRFCPHCGVDLDAPLKPEELEQLARQGLEKAQSIIARGEDLHQALADCEEAISYLPESAPAHHLRGIILERLGRREEASLAYQEALRLDPNLADARANLAGIDPAFRAAAQPYPPAYPPAYPPDPPARPGSRRGWLIAGAVGLVILLAAGAVFLLNGAGVFIPKQSLVYQPNMSLIASVTPADLEKAAQVLTERWHALGYDFVTFRVTGANQISGDVPQGLPAETIEGARAIGLVEFVDFGSTSLPPGTLVTTDLLFSYFPSAGGTNLHTIMTNAEIKSVEVTKDTLNKYGVNFSLSEKGTKILAEFSARNIGRYLGIVLDKKVISSPAIQSAILDGKGVIAGSFTAQEANELVAYLKTVPLPVPLK